ncbi:MAG: hypothetical protein H6810_05780 [Phycisphaeraceae bacterium]|nr:MAG: hypothetical protein H6810_05780 [Phycisphaeraceae bacterium]
MNMIRSSRFVVVVALLAFPTGAVGGDAPPSDLCADATLIADGLYMGDTTGHGTDGNADCAESSFSPDVWYRYIAPEDGVLTLDMCGSLFDTMLSVHTGCPGDETNQIACSDDFDCNGNGTPSDDGWVSYLRTPIEQGVEYIIRVSGWNGDFGGYVLDVSHDLPPTGGADVLIGEIGECVQYGRIGDVIGCAMDSPVCNDGSEPLDWYPIEDGRHPFMAFNMYRLFNGRLTQIGMSSIKHGFASGQADACGLGCIPYPNSTHTGVGCSDTYWAGLNAIQSNMGPRAEINPWTPSYTYFGSHIDQTSGQGHDAIQHRLQMHDADLDPLQNPGAQYFCELYVLAHDDHDHMNSVAHEPVGVSGVPGDTWSFDVSGGLTDLGPAIAAWPGAEVVIVPEEPVDDGRVFIASKITDLGGTWRYEFAVYNHDMASAVQSFTVPVPAARQVTNIGFHAVESHDEPFSNDPWTATRTAEGVVWSTEPYSVNPNANPLRWGTMYSFWFDSDAPPGETNVGVEPYFPGGSSLTARMAGPASCPADINNDGILDLADVQGFISAFLAHDPPADLAPPFGVYDLADLQAFIASFAAGCP